jgi:hypothetical protein
MRRAASSGHEISPRVDLEEVVVEGNLTAGGTGQQRGCGGPMMTRRGGGAQSLLGQQLGRGGGELGVASGAAHGG